MVSRRGGGAAAGAAHGPPAACAEARDAPRNARGQRPSPRKGDATDEQAEPPRDVGPDAAAPRDHAARASSRCPADQLTSHPIAGMRTPVELIVHMYATHRAARRERAHGHARRVRREGRCVGGDQDPRAAAGVREEELGRGRPRGARGDRRAAGRARSGTLGGRSPGAAMYRLHPRRVPSPPRPALRVRAHATASSRSMVWDFDHNAPEFRPGQPAAG